MVLTEFPHSWKSMEKNLVMESHGKWAEKIKSWKLKNILKKSWNFFTADHESRTRNSDNSISTGLLQWFGYGTLSVYVLDSQFVILGGRQTIFSTHYFQFEKRFDFICVYVMNTCDCFLCLPSWHHGKQRTLSWKIMAKSWNFIIRFLWEPCTYYLTVFKRQV